MRLSLTVGSGQRGGEKKVNYNQNHDGNEYNGRQSDSRHGKTLALYLALFNSRIANYTANERANAEAEFHGYGKYQHNGAYDKQRLIGRKRIAITHYNEKCADYRQYERNYRQHTAVL